MTNNIGQMTESLGFDPGLTPASLALFSAAQGASRVCTGIASELALGWNNPRWLCCGSGASGSGGIPRPAFFVLASLISCASHFILAVSTSEEAFAFGVTLSGVVGYIMINYNLARKSALAPQSYVLTSCVSLLTLLQAFGSIWPLMVLITGEVFGTHHVGAN